jgi:small-conductance mechanosensitive channel
MKVVRKWTWTLPVTAVVLSWTWPCLAQDAPAGADLGRLAGIVRWGGVFVSAFVVAGALLALRVITSLTSRLGARFSTRRMLFQKVESFLRFGLYVVTALIVMGLSIRLDSTAITVIGGALAFAVGFAMRDLVAAFIAGVTIMFDRPFQVGDRVQYAGQYGDIEAIGLRSVRMNTLDHNIVTIPNNKVLTDVAASGNYGALEMQVAMTFYIGVDQDVALARELVRETCLMSRYCFLEREVPVLAKQVIIEDYVAYQLIARPYVLDLKYEKSFETDVHMTVQRLFREHQVLPPAMLRRSMDAYPAVAVPTAAE